MFSLWRTVQVLLTKYLPPRFAYRFEQWARHQRAAFFPAYATIRHLPHLRGSISTHTFSQPTQSDTYLFPGNSVPDWVKHDMLILGSTIEPKLYPSESLLAQYRTVTISNSVFPGTVYESLLNQLSHTQYEYCFMLPWLKKGGADKVALQFISAVVERADVRVLVILSEPTDSPWKDRLPASSNVTCVTLDKAFHSLDLAAQQLIIATLIQHCVSRVLHIMNSRIAWQTLSIYGRSLSNALTIYTHAFCIDFAPDGTPSGYIIEFLAETHEYITNIYTENIHFIDHCMLLYGLSRNKFILHRQWISLAPQRLVWEPNKSIVWAGRLDRQKRPDILLKIAQGTPEIPYYVFGYSTNDECAPTVKTLQALPNVRFHHGFNSFAEIALCKPAALLYTSQWDGLPNILLEAGSYMIPVIAPKVGGISELVTQETGYLIDDFTSVHDYVKALQFVIKNASDAHLKAQAMYKHLSELYSQNAFNAIIDIYLTSSSPK